MLINVKKVKLINEKFNGPNAFTDMIDAVDVFAFDEFFENSPDILDSGYFKVKIEFCEYNNDD